MNQFIFCIQANVFESGANMGRVYAPFPQGSTTYGPKGSPLGTTLRYQFLADGP